MPECRTTATGCVSSRKICETPQIYGCEYFKICETPQIYGCEHFQNLRNATILRLLTQPVAGKRAPTRAYGIGFLVM